MGWLKDGLVSHAMGFGLAIMIHVTILIYGHKLSLVGKLPI